jgi:BlaI family transcriptional regulator, penicillinase repressor
MVSRKPKSPPVLSRRERQIMDLLYRLGAASAADVHRDLPDAPTYTTVRGLLRVLVEKGHAVYEQDGRRYVYKPSTPRPAAGASSIAHVVNTFFAGSAADALVALIGSEAEGITDAELARLSAVVAKARRNKDGRA